MNTMRVKLPFSLFCLLFCVTPGLIAQNIIEDQGIGLSREEVEFIVKYWPAQMQKAAANDTGDRIELLNRALVSKKMASEAEGENAQADADLYWKHKFAIRNTQREYVFTRYMRSLTVPDMSQLAAERYLTNKDEYALVPEERLSSHLLLRCVPGQCQDPTEKQSLAKKIHADLLAGANFEELVLAHSEDPGSKNKGGKFDKWLKKGEPKVSPPYIGGVYSIDKVGDYSAVVQTQYGWHIIRLDGIREAHYKSYDEVKDAIVAALQGEYRKLAGKEFEAKYRMSDQTVMDNAALEEILAPYRTNETTGLEKQPAQLEQPGNRDEADIKNLPAPTLETD